MKRTIALVVLSYASIAAFASAPSRVSAPAETAAFASATSRMAAPAENVVKLTAKKFEFSPDRITVKKGTPVVLELTSEDSKHGFNLPDFKVRADVKPGSVTRVTFTPDKTGTFTFACDVFCGSGHEDMSGTLVVAD